MKKKDNRLKFGLGEGKPGSLFWVGLLILLLFGGGLLWLRAPLPSTELQLEFPGIDLPGDGSDTALQASQLEARSLIVSYPLKIWIGKQGVFTLQAISGVIDDVQREGNTSPISDAFQVMLEVRPEVQGIEFDPMGTLISPLAPGENLVLKWKILTQQTGEYSGRAWVYLNWISASGEITRQTLFAIPIELEAISFLGIPTESLEKVCVAGIGGGIAFLLLSFRQPGK
jgi:hypothetical protein